MEANNDIQTGTETNSGIESGIEDEYDVYYYADDGEHAYVIGARNIDDRAEEQDFDVKEGHQMVETKHFVCEAGLVNGFSAHSVHEINDSIGSWLSDYFAEIGTPEEAIEAARTHWSKPADEREKETY